jgi:lipooligosaccharide transport system permease protein
MTHRENTKSTTQLIPKLTYRVWHVWRRNLDVFTKTAHVNFLPSLLEPILYLIAFGFGLGILVAGPVEGMPYINWIAPGLVAIAVMYGAFFECTYASFVRMYFQKTFDAIITTPVNVEEVIAGELLWGATRAVINSTIVLAVIAGFGLVSSPLAVLVPAVAFFGGLLFAAFGMCFTALARNIDFFNYPVYLLITPMFLIGGTFVPLSIMPSSIQTIAIAGLPLTQIVNLLRGLITGRFEGFLGLSPEIIVLSAILWISIATLIFFILSIYLMKKKLIK